MWVLLRLDVRAEVCCRKNEGARRGGLEARKGREHQGKPAPKMKRGAPHRAEHPVEKTKPVERLAQRTARIMMLRMMLTTMHAVQIIIHCLYFMMTGGLLASRASAFCQPQMRV